MRVIITALAWIAILCALLSPAVAPQLEAQAGRAGFARVTLPADARMHPNAQTEWWYYTGHLHDRSGRSFGFEIVTFKLQGLAGMGLAGLPSSGYRIDLAITDEARGKFFSAVNYVAPSPGKTVMSTSNLTIRVAGGSASVAIDTLPAKDLEYRLRGTLPAGSIDLTVDTARRPLLEGGNGVVSMGAGGYSYYYSLTNLRSRGTLTVGGQRFAVSGTTWMDHQWGSWRWQQVRGWDWMGVQLDNGTSVVLSNFAGSRLATKAAAASFPDGTQMITTNSSMTPLNRFWTSPVTGTRYPQGWHIRVQSLGLDAQVLPTVPGQEVVDPLSLGPSYWEGSCRVTGTLHGKPITGLAYTELVGYGSRSVLGL